MHGSNAELQGSRSGKDGVKAFEEKITTNLS
jgi:hypothetical protein